MAPILRLGVRGGNLGKSSRPFLFTEKRTPFPLSPKGKAFVFLFIKKKKEKLQSPLDKHKKKYYTISVKQRRTFSVLTLRRDVPGSISSENMRAQLLHGMLCIAG